MTSIVVSSDDHTTCQSIGKKIAKALGYQYVGRSLLEEVAEEYDLPEDKLRAVLDPTSRRRFVPKTRRHLLACIQAMALGELLEDDIVCAGLGAHLYVRDVSHVLMIRVLTDTAANVQKVATKKKVTVRKATKLIEQEKAKQREWSVNAFGVDENDPALYDMVISVAQIEADRLVEIMENMATYRKFQPMTYSRKQLADLALAATVRSSLLGKYTDIRVKAKDDTAIVHVKCATRNKKKTVESIREIAKQVPGVALAEVHAVRSLAALAGVE